MKSTDFTLILRSDLGELSTLHQFLDDVLRDADPDVRSRCELAIDEAASNAIRHGNAEDPAKKVRIKLTMKGRGLECRVKDEGSGFDVSGLPDPTEEPMLMRTHGRGVFLIRELADDVRFKDGGRVLEMVFQPRGPA